MSQSYKVFIGGSILVIGNEAENATVFNTKLSNPTTSEWGKLIKELEASENSALVIGETKSNWENFKTNYQLILAAGGMVKNQNGDWLFIFRNGVWDLPKGKLEAEENIEICAVREVEEECGIGRPEITHALQPTYHTYALDGQRILKKTFWFLMSSQDATEPKPQTEEGITMVRWVSAADAALLAEKSFGSIKMVVNEGLSLTRQTT